MKPREFEKFLEGYINEELWNERNRNVVEANTGGYDLVVIDKREPAF